MKFLQKYLSALLLIAIFTLPVSAGILEDITNTMKSKVNETIATLKDKSLLKCEKNVKISQLSEGMFDYTLMSKLSIGKTNWGRFNSKQKKEFVELFTIRMKQSYIEKAHLLTDEKVDVFKAVQINPTRIQLGLVIKGKDKDTEMLYKYYRTKQKTWLIYDVEIAKISILQTYRAQFAEKLSNGSVEELLEQLRTTQTKQS